MAILVVPKLDGIRKIERPPHCHFEIEEQNSNLGNRFAVLMMSVLELSLTKIREDVRMEAKLPRFHVFDGSTRLVIEAHDQEDALCLCVEMGWEFVCCL